MDRKQAESLWIDTEKRSIAIEDVLKKIATESKELQSNIRSLNEEEALKRLEYSHHRKELNNLRILQNYVLGFGIDTKTLRLLAKAAKEREDGQILTAEDIEGSIRGGTGRVFQG